METVHRRKCAHSIYLIYTDLISGSTLSPFWLRDRFASRITWLKTGQVDYIFLHKTSSIIYFCSYFVHLQYNCSFWPAIRQYNLRLFLCEESVYIIFPNKLGKAVVTRKNVLVTTQRRVKFNPPSRNPLKGISKILETAVSWCFSQKDLKDCGYGRIFHSNYRGIESRPP